MASAFTANAIRSRRRDPDARFGVGLRVSHLLNTVDLEPPGLPPACILIVRRLADPLPRHLPPDPWAVAPAGAWERAAQSDLAEIYRRAAHPAHEPVPLNAAAVLFADQGELLSCLARDLLRGAARTLWWWRAILRSLPASAVSALLAAWRREARHIPAALAHLAASGDAGWVLKALSSPQAWALLEDVTRAFEFSLGNIAPEPQSGLISQRASAPVSRRWAEGGTIFDPTWKDLPAPPPPWHGVIPEHLVPADLAAEPMALLGVALVLHRAPQIARSRRFVQGFAAWHQSKKQSPRRFSEAALHSPQPAAAAAHVAPDTPIAQEVQCVEVRREDTRAESTPGSDPLPIGAAVLPQAPDGEASGRELMGSDAVHAQATDASDGVNLPSEGAPTSVARALDPILKRALPQNAPLATSLVESILSGQQEISSPGLPQTAHQIQLEPPSSALPTKTKLATAEPVQTGLGGLLFLINALKALRLPQSLEKECGCELGLGSWALLELLARCLLGPRLTQLASDPVWRVLAVLDGRAPEIIPGSNFMPAQCYRVPKAWLSAALTDQEPENIAVRFRVNHLELWSMLGFPLMVRTFDQPPSASVIAEEISLFARTARPASFDAITDSAPRGCRPLGVDPSQPLQRFLAFLVPYFRWRLSLALGLPQIHHVDIAKQLLLHRAEIWITSSHVDMVMDLNQASGRIRLSGLDADPGWVPELGRVVKFHFRKMSAS